MHEKHAVVLASKVEHLEIVFRQDILWSELHTPEPQHNSFIEVIILCRLAFF